MFELLKGKKAENASLEEKSTSSQESDDVSDVSIEQEYLGKSLSYLSTEKKKLQDQSDMLNRKMASLQETYSRLLEERKQATIEQQQASSDVYRLSSEWLENDLPSSLNLLSVNDISDSDSELLDILVQKQALLQEKKKLEQEKDSVCEQLDQALLEEAEQIKNIRSDIARLNKTNKSIDDAINAVAVENSDMSTDEPANIKNPQISKHRREANKVRGVFFFNLSSFLKKDCELEYSPWKLLLHYAIIMVAISLIGILYSLELPYIITLCLVYFVFGPSLIYFHHRRKYEKKKFQFAVRYIEQMLFSFMRRSKILNALEETRILLSGKIAEAVDYAILKIRHGQSKEDLYEEALSEIEKLFPCARVKNLHELLVEVENVGGKHNSALDIMLEDVREWDVRSNNFMQEQAVKGMSIIVSILMSLGVCFFMTNVLPDDMGGDITGFGLYQVLTTVSLIVMFFIYRFSARKLTSSWVNDDLGENEERIKADYETVSKYSENPNGKIKPILAMTRIQTAMEKAFPRWVIRFSLLASTKPIPVALTESTDKAPTVMKDELIKLNNNLEYDPNSIHPYVEFFEHFDLPQVRSMMMMVYSLSSASTEDADKHILSIVKRNHQLQAVAEKIEYEEKMALFTLFSTIPMILACVIMMVDVAMIVINMMNTVM